MAADSRLEAELILPYGQTDLCPVQTSCTLHNMWMTVGSCDNCNASVSFLVKDMELGCKEGGVDFAQA